MNLLITDSIDDPNNIPVIKYNLNSCVKRIKKIKLSQMFEFKPISLNRLDSKKVTPLERILAKILKENLLIFELTQRTLLMCLAGSCFPSELKDGDLFVFRKGCCFVKLCHLPQKILNDYCVTR